MITLGEAHQMCVTGDKKLTVLKATPVVSGEWYSDTIMEYLVEHRSQRCAVKETKNEVFVLVH